MSLDYSIQLPRMTIRCRSTKLIWFGFAWMLLSPVGYAVAAPCGDVFSETLASCCPSKYISLCCPGITEPCNATFKVPPSLEVQNNSPPGIQKPAEWRKPYCMRPSNSTACEAGFYLDSASRKVKPCPDGFYCPQNLLCIIPCPVGAYCMRDTLVNSTKKHPRLCREGGKCCSPSQSVPLYDKLSKALLCPGTQKPVPCPEGNYCPEVTIKKTCPKGHFCRNGSTEPQECPLLSICKKGSSAPVSAPAGLLLIVFLFLLWILFLYCFKHEKKVGFYYNHYKEKWFTRNYIKKNLKTGQKMSLDGIDTSMQEYRRNAVAKTHTISITFTELGLVLKKGGRRVLEGVTGEIKPGELTAVMGPSGSGKTTLLNTLSGKAYYGKRTGRIFINNAMVDDLGAYRNITGFVPQEDVMHRSLTVIEVLTYQAHLRLPSSTSNEERKHKITEVLQLLDLERVKDTTIGDEETRGISGGQRKRVNIGMELVADPTLLFLDEPTSGLDSTSSLMVVDALKAVAENAKLTVVCVIHQPRYEIFSTFHKVLFLGLGGRTVFQGTVEEADDYFHNRGFEKPINVNPADFYMDVIGGMYESSQPQALSLVEAWEQNQINTGDSEREGGPIQETVRTVGANNFALDLDLDGVTLAQMKESSNDSVDTGPSTAFQRRKMPNFFVQFWIFLRREVYLQLRLARSLLLDQFLVLIAGATLGVLRREAPLDEFFILQTLSSLAIGLTAMLSALRCFGNNRTSFWRESSAGINRVSYFFAVNVAQVPIILVTPLMYLSLLYSLVAPRGLFRFHYVATLGAQFVCTGVGYAISAIFSPKNSQMVSITYVLICSLVSGSSPSLCKMNNAALGPLLYNLSYCRWYLEALFEKEANRYPRVMAPYVHGLATKNGYSLDNYSTCVAVLFGMGFAYRLLALLFLLFTNRGKQQ